MYKVLMIDKNQFFREAIKKLLSLDGICEVVSEADDTQDLMSLFDRHRPDIIIIESGDDPADAMSNINKLLQIYPSAKVAALTSQQEFKYFKQALLAGIKGYLLKSMEPETIRKAIKNIIEGQIYIHPLFMRTFIKDYLRLKELEDKVTIQNNFSRPIHLLTRRECEILQLLSEGYTITELGHKILITEKTVKNHVSSILDKLHVKDRTQAVVKAVKNGWVDLQRR